MSTQYQVKDITKLTGIDRESLRFYENKGLLQKPLRSSSGYRLYSPDTVTRLKFIKLAQSVGFSLKEIKELLNIGREKKISKKELEPILHSKIEHIDEQINKLKGMKKLLVNFSKKPLPKTSKGKCPILTQFSFLKDAL